MNRLVLQGLVLGAALLLVLGGCSREEKSSAPAAEAAEAAAEATPAPTPAPGHEPAPAPEGTPRPEVQPPPPDEAATTTTAEDAATTPAASPVAEAAPPPPAATPDVHQQAVISYNQMHASAELFVSGEAGPASVKDMASDLQKQVDGFRQNLRPVDAKMEPMLRDASEALAELQTLPDDSPRVEELVGRVREAMRRMEKE